MRTMSESVPDPASSDGWRRAGSASLPEVFRSVPIPQGASFWRKILAFAGPGFLVSVGYMDPGNWATDLAGGAKYGYTLLFVILISNLMAILLQHLCVQLGVVELGFMPSAGILKNKEMLFIAIGILGATVMPHNLYLHSSIVQTRNFERNDAGKAEAIKFATLDSTFALMFALFINGGILILAAAA